MTLISMYDATSVGNLPKFDGSSKTVAIAGYCDGNLPTDWINMVHAFPELAKMQRVVSIASRFSTIARVIDYEPHQPIYGDPAGVARWIVDMVHHGVFRPTFYADRSDMPALQAAIQKTSLRRDQFGEWLAFPGGDATKLLAEGLDAVQVNFQKTFDGSVCKPEFFPSVAPVPHPTPKPHEVMGRAEVSFTHPAGEKGTVHAVVGHTLGTREYTIHGVPSTHRGQWRVKHLGR